MAVLQRTSQRHTHGCGCPTSLTDDKYSNEYSNQLLQIGRRTDLATPLTSDNPLPEPICGHLRIKRLQVRVLPSARKVETGQRPRTGTGTGPLSCPEMISVHDGLYGSAQGPRAGHGGAAATWQYPPALRRLPGARHRRRRPDDRRAHRPVRGRPDPPRGRAGTDPAARRGRCLEDGRTKAGFGALLDRWLGRHEMAVTTRVTYESLIRTTSAPPSALCLSRSCTAAPPRPWKRSTVTSAGAARDGPTAMPARPSRPPRRGPGPTTPPTGKIGGSSPTVRAGAGNRVDGDNQQRWSPR